MPASSCSTGYEPSAQTTGNNEPSSRQAAAAASQDCFAVSRTRSQSHTDGAKAPETPDHSTPGVGQVLAWLPTV